MEASKNSTKKLLPNRSNYKELRGLDGMPYRQYDGKAVPLFRKGDSFRNKPQPVFEGYANTFDMSDGTDVENYQKIIDMCAKKHAVICKEVVMPVPEKDKFVIFVRWMEYYLTDPDSAVESNNKLEETNDA